MDAAAEIITTTAAPSNDDAGLASELEAIIGGASEPEPAAAEPEPEPDAIAADEEERLVAAAQARMEERRQREPLDATRRELAELRQLVAQTPGIHAIAAAIRAKDPRAIESAFAAAGIDSGQALHLLTKAKLAPDPAEAMESAIERAVRNVLGPLVQQPEAQPEAPIEDAAVEGYNGFVAASSEKYPRQAALGDLAGPAAIAWVRRTLIPKGVDTTDLTNAQISAMFERHLEKQAKPSGAPIASGEAQSQPPGASSASGGPARTTSSAPRSITNGHAADAPRSVPRTQREIDAALEKELEAMRRAERA